VIVDGVELRQLVPQVLSVLVRRGADFATAEDAVQEALIRGVWAWQEELPFDPKAWLITVAWRAFVDLARSDAARRDREVRFDTEPPTGAVPSADDTLRLFFLCAHPELTPSSAVALTLRAVGGLTTRQIAQAYLVPESTMAQRISRAKRTVGRSGLDRSRHDTNGTSRSFAHPRTSALELVWSLPADTLFQRRRPSASSSSGTGTPTRSSNTVRTLMTSWSRSFDGLGLRRAPR
jgi:RNA polymerase sigma factor (sigma-70 family)